ncbi:hypothetical protein evm_014207 [Chilo suppressalis]|nr:hypothetical protein evm_014207 [Chilo suppressalis]
MTKTSITDLHKNAESFQEFYNLDITGELNLWHNLWMKNALSDDQLRDIEVVVLFDEANIFYPALVFSFEHPARGHKDHEGQEISDYRGLPLTDNRRSTTLSWIVEQDNVMHGFGGYFDCKLYGDEMISIVPSTHSPGMISWFPVFIPIKTPLRVQKGEKITATFWRCVDTRRVWYEWIVEIGNRITPLHNCNGRSSEMLL